MPLTWEIRESVLVVTFIGDYTFLEAQQAVNEGLMQLAGRSGVSLLLDARSSQANLSAEEIRERAYWVASLRARGIFHCAVVLNEQLHRYGMARMFQTRAEMQGIGMRLFHNMEEALAWLETVKS